MAGISACATTPASAFGGSAQGPLATNLTCCADRSVRLTAADYAAICPGVPARDGARGGVPGGCRGAGAACPRTESRVGRTGAVRCGHGPLRGGVRSARTLRRVSPDLLDLTATDLAARIRRRDRALR